MDAWIEFFILWVLISALAGIVFGYFATNQKIDTPPINIADNQEDQ